MISRHQTLSLLALGMLPGIVIWLFSSWLTGEIEPWDADTPIWTFSWFIVAVLGGLTGHARGVCVPLGYALGQLLVTLKPVFIGEFGVLAWMFIGGYTVVAVTLTLAIVGVTALMKRLLLKCRSKDNDA